MTTLITGATGFIGRYVCAQLTRDNQPVVAMLRDPQRQLPRLKSLVNELGGQANLLTGIAGDLDAPSLGLKADLPRLTAVVHLGARFAWRLRAPEAHATNVSGSLEVAALAARHRCRLVMVTGFMLENLRHLEEIGIRSHNPEETDWSTVYRQVGSYEASKLEAAIRVRQFAADSGHDLVEVQPATVAGHSITGDLDPAQPLYGLIDNLARGRLALVPGTPRHWLPLVAVDHLASLIALAATANQPPSRLLALDQNTPPLRDLLGMVAETMNRKPPQRFIPIPALKAILSLPGMARLMNTYPEALAFIQPDRFDPAASDAFGQQYGLSHPPVRDTLRVTVNRYCSV